MILVVIGNQQSAEQFTDELVTSFNGRIQRLSASHIKDIDSRMAYLSRFMTGHIKHSLFLTVLPTISTPEEIDFLRLHGAYVAHVHGPMSAAHNQIRILHTDLIVKLNAKKAPPHVFDADEVFSELLRRHRRQQ
jgi:hypothetical protein